ncbi:hypothetical protein O181_025795 [Austropuccinia psidii MF-1]|uniref:Uncharacterized protein n=1 Tax=Austropuccinia psidii MF-1 TaxID=1389203 RepID=A0A9Q3CN70_9BASI|nr:hypothetical protein [Austropuccinia psidii MF-1]
MSYSKPHKSLSGSVHVSDSESSIEYVQTQSLLSPNIPLTIPIASSMTVSGFNIDVGNLKAQTSSTWSIPNIFVTPIPPNPTNTQMHLSEGPGSTPEIAQKANPQSKFTCEFLLNPGWNPITSQDPFGQSKQPTLNIPSGSQVHVGNEKRVDGRQKRRPLENVNWSGFLEGNPGLMLPQNMAPKGKSVQSKEPIEDCDELYASSPLVHKEKVTGCHHPYASKTRTGHASSSREEIVDDEDENMSSTQSEINDEPRGDNFMAHEQGTPSNSASQKAQKKWLKAELPENVHGMRSAVHAHCLFLLKVRDKDFSSLPAPPSTEEGEISIEVAGHLGYVPKDVFNEPSTEVQSQGFQRYCKNELHKLGLKQFTQDWESSWQNPFNELMSMVFYRTFCLALVSTKYHHYC